MAGDLVGDGGQVHDEARGVLDFWFALPPERHFAKDEALDREIAARFGALRHRLAATGAAGWGGAPDTLLAAVIVLDQFSRNLFRGSAEAYASDDAALALTRRAIARGWDAAMPAERRVFLYLPLMHGEDAGVQAESVAMFEALGIAENLAFARDHAAVIARFGRFPSRNAALGRATTAAEQAYLDAGGGW